MTTAAAEPSCLRRRIGASLALAAAGVGGTATTAAADDYVVQPGDTVSHIALRAGATVREIVAANNLDARATIRIGQVLTIPTAAPAPVAVYPATAGTHTVVSGDTVSALAARYGSTVQAISTANSLNASAMIRIGQVLAIPGATSTAGTTSAPTTLVGSTFAGRTYPAHVVAAANQNKANLLAVGVPRTADMQALVASTAQAMGVDPALAQAVAFQESGFNHASVSPANAIGTMQVIPTSGDWASDMVGRELNLLDPSDNVVAGVAILRRLVETSPDLSTAIAGYYQGQRSVSVNGMYADTRRYVANVQTLMSRFA